MKNKDPKVEKHVHLFGFILLLAVWLTLFVRAGLINSYPYYVDLVQGNQDQVKYLDHKLFTELASLSNGLFVSKCLNALLFVITWTWTNLLLMSCVASLIGEFGRIHITDEKNAGCKINIIGALIRGFFIYFFILAGQLVLEGQLPLPSSGLEAKDTTLLQMTYFRLAFVSTLFGFVVGYRPSFFNDMLNKFLQDPVPHTPSSKV